MRLLARPLRRHCVPPEFLWAPATGEDREAGPHGALERSPTRGLLAAGTGGRARPLPSCGRLSPVPYSIGRPSKQMVTHASRVELPGQTV